MRTLDNAMETVVYPRLGKLSPQIKRLFQQEMHGHARVAPKAGLHEAEFYGLRPWATGDSRRWIHWRTTARLGELSVRQFERQQRQQMCVLLDLHLPQTNRKNEVDEGCEHAISFLATLAHQTAMHGGDRLAVAVAAHECFALPHVQSPLLVNELLERLAVIRASHAPDLSTAMQGIRLPLLSNPRLLVISTREDQSARLRQGFASTDSLESRIQLRWLNVSQGELEPYFTWT